jgi:hypothetical protein
VIFLPCHEPLPHGFPPSSRTSSPSYKVYWSRSCQPACGRTSCPPWAPHQNEAPDAHPRTLCSWQRPLPDARVPSNCARCPAAKIRQPRFSAWSAASTRTSPKQRSSSIARPVARAQRPGAAPLAHRRSHREDGPAEDEQLPTHGSLREAPARRRPDRSFKSDAGPPQGRNLPRRPTLRRSHPHRSRSNLPADGRQLGYRVVFLKRPSSSWRYQLAFEPACIARDRPPGASTVR